MTARQLRTACALGAAVLCLVPLAADAQEIQVTVVEPSFLHPVFGEVKMAVEVSGAPAIERIEFYLDGRLLGAVTEPPYEMMVDAGQQNLEHKFQAVAYTPAGTTHTGTVETPKIRVDEEIDLGLRQLYVTVSDKDKRILDLDRDDFGVTDAGVRESLVTFERGDAPLTAVLLLDVSESMAGPRLDAALAGARSFIDGMRPLDEAMVMLFSDRLTRTTSFTTQKADLHKALSDVKAVGGTALNDHLYLALNRLDSRQGRRVVILLSDGIDVLSALRMRDVLWRARRSQALIYWIHLSDTGDEIPRVASSWRDANSNVREFELLRSTVEESGGRLELLEEPEELEMAFTGVLQELREQYVLGYYPSNQRRDGSWRTVKVRTNRSSVKIRTRDGYIDF